MEHLIPFFSNEGRRFALMLDREEEYKQTFCKLIANGDIKLIVFDLDNTLWHGAVGEGTAEPDEGKIGFIKQLVGAGVMCSIASYNHFDVAQDYLKALGIWDYFIFPQISNQGSKSSMIKNILEKTNLQAKHTIFVDDEFRNLAEARHAIDKLMMLVPEWLFCINSELIPQKSNTRLAEYKILEAKDKTKADYLTNEEFLEFSQIHVYIGQNCQSHSSRIMELVNRTNQLNFTKQKLNEDQLASLLNNEQKVCRVVQVKDKFGDYGICGFFCLDKMEFKLEHFLFSCRVLGMRVESAVYKYLKKPKVEIISPVAISHFEEDSCCISILEVEDVTVVNEKKEFYDVMLKGGCQFTAIMPTLERCKKYSFGLMDNFSPMIIKGHTASIVQIGTIPETLLKRFEKVLFIEDNIFNGQWKFFVITVSEDFVRHVWRIKGTDAVFVFGSRKEPREISYLHTLLSSEDLIWLQENAEFKGFISSSEFFFNLQKMRERLPSQTKMIIVNFRRPFSNDPLDVVERLNILNAAIDEFVKLHNNVYLLDLRQLIGEDDLLEPSSLFHYKWHKNIALANLLMEMVEQNDK